MKLEIASDGSCNIYDEAGRHIGHVADEGTAKKWVKDTFGKEAQLKKSDITHELKGAERKG